MSPSRFEITYCLSQEEHTATVLAHIWRTRGLGTLAVVLAVVVVSAAVRGTDGLAAAAVGVLAGGLYVLLLAFVIVPRQVRGIHREQRSAPEQKILKVNDDGVEIDQESGVFRARWVDFVMWIETRSTLAIYVNRGMMLPLPKQALGEACVSFIRDRMITSGLRRSGKLRRT